MVHILFAELHNLLHSRGGIFARLHRLYSRENRRDISSSAKHKAGQIRAFGSKAQCGASPFNRDYHPLFGNILCCDRGEDRFQLTEHALAGALGVRILPVSHHGWRIFCNTYRLAPRGRADLCPRLHGDNDGEMRLRDLILRRGSVDAYQLFAEYNIL